MKVKLSKKAEKNGRTDSFYLPLKQGFTLYPTMTVDYPTSPTTALIIM